MHKQEVMIFVRIVVFLALLTACGCGVTQCTDKHYSGWRAVPGNPGGSRSTLSVASLQLDTSRNVLFGIAFTPPSPILPLNSGVWRCMRPNTSSVWRNIKTTGMPPVTCPIVIDQERGILYSIASDNSGNVGIWRCSNSAGLYSWADMEFKNDGISSLAYDSIRNILYVGTDPSGVWRCVSPESMSSWKHINFELDFYRVGLGIVLCDSDHDTLYAGTCSGGVWRCSDPTGTPHWEKIGGNLPPAQQVSSLAYDRAHDILYAGRINGGLWRCINPRYSPSWSQTGGVIKSWTITSIVCDSNGNQIYVAVLDEKMKEKGVWRSPTQGKFAWQRMNGSIGTRRIYSLIIDANRKILYAGAEGGVWSHELFRTIGKNP